MNDFDRQIAFSGRRLRELRGASSQAELARRAGVTQPTVDRLENGRTSPRHSTVLKLAKALSVDPEDLLDISGRPPCETGKIESCTGDRAHELLRTCESGTTLRIAGDVEEPLVIDREITVNIEAEGTVAGLRVTAGAVVFSGGTISGELANSEPLVQVNGACSLRIEGSLVCDSLAGGVRCTGGSKLALVRTRVEDCVGSPAILVRGRSQASLLRGTVARTAGSGVLVTGVGARIEMHFCVVGESEGHGIEVADGATAYVRHGWIDTNELAGISVKDASAEVVRCHIHSNQENGCRVSDSGQLEIRDCILDANQFSGLWSVGSGSVINATRVRVLGGVVAANIAATDYGRIHLQDSDVCNSKDAGAHVRLYGHLEADDVTFAGNASGEIVALHMASVELRNCRLLSGGRFSVYSSNESEVSIDSHCIVHAPARTRRGAIVAGPVEAIDLEARLRSGRMTEEQGAPLRRPPQS